MVSRVAKRNFPRPFSATKMMNLQSSKAYTSLSDLHAGFHSAPNSVNIPGQFDTVRLIRQETDASTSTFSVHQVEPGSDIIVLSVPDTRLPNDLKELLQSGEDLLAEVKRLVAEERVTIREADVDLLSPILRMDKLVCVGLNYSGYCKAQGLDRPKNPVCFSKFPSTVVGPNDNVVLPSNSDQVDWEVELAIVIGKKAKGVKHDEADDYIFGYTVAQDISARDLHQPSFNGGQVLLGKAMDTFCPLGPAVVAKEDISNVNNLSVKTWVNGQLKQDGNTSELIFKPSDIVSYLSQFFTLLPGDVILTGTPAGVGFVREPPEFLKKGDVIVSEIEGIGRLRNNVV